MIISCEKCNKKFEISDNLIPDDGRLLECGSCSYQWHYIPQNRIKLINEVKDIDAPIKVKKISKKNKTKKIITNENNDFFSTQTSHIKSKSVGFLSYLLAISISFVAFIILVDTFKLSISSFIPGIDFYLSSLYESLKDILLFFEDLTK